MPIGFVPLDESIYQPNNVKTSTDAKSVYEAEAAGPDSFTIFWKYVSDRPISKPDLLLGSGMAITPATVVRMKIQIIISWKNM